jgi:hypothetical protein
MTRDNDEAIDLDLMWLNNIAYEVEQGKPVNPEELRSIATALASYMRVLRSECETLTGQRDSARRERNEAWERIKLAQKIVGEMQDTFKHLKPQAE